MNQDAAIGWRFVGLAAGASVVSVMVLMIAADAFAPNDSISAAVFYGGTILVSAIMAVLVRSYTTSRKWWLVPLLASPATLVLLFTLVVNLMLRLGPVGPSHGDGIYGPWNEKYAAAYEDGTRDGGGAARLQDKTIWIKLYRKPNTLIARDKIELRCCMLSGEVEWLPNDGAQVTLFQEGIERTGDEAVYNDPYSVALARSGKRAMVRLTYALDKDTGRFVRTGFRLLDPTVEVLSR